VRPFGLLGTGGRREPRSIRSRRLSKSARGARRHSGRGAYAGRDGRRSAAAERGSGWTRRTGGTTAGARPRRTCVLLALPRPGDALALLTVTRSRQLLRRAPLDARLRRLGAPAPRDRARERPFSGARVAAIALVVRRRRALAFRCPPSAAASPVEGGDNA